MNPKPTRLIQSLLLRWEKQPQWLWFVSALWLALIIGIAVWLDLGSTGLVDETEPLFAEAARQMVVTGDWVTPYFNGATRFDKPPLVYWLMAIAYQTIGVNEWAVRFPSALSATVLTVFGFYTLRYFGVPRPAAATETANSAGNQSSRLATSLWLSGWIGGALVILNMETIAWGRVGVSDMLLSGCMGSALLAFFWGYAQPGQPGQARWYLAFYGLSALAVLTKGPVGIVLPILIIAAFLLYVGQLRQVIAEMQLLRGSLLFLVIALPWYILVIRANGEDYINSFFGYHNLERFTQVVNNHWAPIWFYVAVVPLAFLPWSVYLPISILRLRVWQPQRWRQQPRSAHLGLFAFFWFAGVFGFFTVAVTKLPSYMIPLLPAAAILVGLFWSDQMVRQSASGNRPPGYGVWLSHLCNIGLAVVLAFAVFYSPHWLTNEPEMPQLSERVQQSGIALIGCVIWALMAIGALFLLLKRQSHWIWSVQLVGFIAFILLALLPAMFIVDAQRQLPLRQLAAAITQVQQPEEPILMIGYSKPSLVFYTQRHITYVAAPSEVSGSLQTFSQQLSRPDAKVHSLLLAARPVRFKDAGIRPDQYKILDEAGAFRLARMTFPIKP